MNNILVSIVVPVYNSEKTIGRCLDSLIEQTYYNIEIICVNDCSNDNSLKILLDYASKDPRIVVINHNVNKNAGGARNTGIKAANGYYVCFVDNDDWMSSDAVQMLINSSDNGNADLVASDWVTYYSEKNQVYNHNLLPNASFEMNMEYVTFHGFRMLGCLWRKGIFVDNDLFYPENIFFEDNAVGDTMLWYAKNIKYVQLPLYYYFISSTSVTGFITKRKITDRITTTELYLANLQKHGFYDKKKTWFDFSCLNICYLTFLMLLQYPHKEIAQEYKRCLRLIKICKPNEFIGKLGLKERIIIKIPIISYWSIRMIKKCLFIRHHI